MAPGPPAWAADSPLPALGFIDLLLYQQDMKGQRLSGLLITLLTSMSIVSRCVLSQA